MDCDFILNPEEDSHEAAVLVMAYFYLAIMVDEESTEEIVDKFYYVLLPILRDGWLDIHGYESLQKTVTNFPDVELLNETIQCLTDELNETEDSGVILEYLFSKTTDDKVQFLCLSILYELVRSDGKITESERNIFENVKSFWSYTTSYFLANELKRIELQKQYNTNRLGGQTYAELNRRKVNLGEKVTSNDSCFIATEVLGREHYALIPLRIYRDKVLKKNCLGKKFVNWYYSNGPYLAKIVGHNPAFKCIVKYFFILPVSRLVAIFYR